MTALVRILCCLSPLVAFSLAACTSNPTRLATPAEGARARIGLLETTDIHTNVLSYDYYRLAEDQNIGLERAATLIRAARKEFENSLTFDSGDTIQGTILADYQAQIAKLPCTHELAVYRAMDAIGYDAATIGNHEFNYGLAYLSQVTGTPFDVTGVPHTKCAGPKFPLVLANVVDAKGGKPLFAPWRILTRTITTHAADGSAAQAKLRIGVIGFTPTGIMEWDQRNLEGKVDALGVVESAQKYVPELRKAGADIVVALVHGGIDPSPYGKNTENAAWHLAAVPGVDVMLLGHSHAIFPDPSNAKSRYATMPEVDNKRGFVRGVPAVMGNYFGKNIGVVDLAIAWHDGHWQVDRAATHAEVRSVKNGDGSYVATDASIEPLVEHEHEGAIAYVKTPIGRSNYPITTYFVAAGDTSALELVNRAERDYVEKYIKASMPQFAGIPVLAAASPFKAGFGGPKDFTDVPAGKLAINNAADLYLYSNTLAAVRTTGAGVKAWLEKSANWFNRIDPTKREPQELVNSRFPTYDFDVLQGNLTYAIDVTKPAGQRVVDLRLAGQPVRDDQPFIVVANNYRASGGGRFPGLDGKSVVISAPDGNREILIAWVRAQGQITRDKFGADHNWRFVPVKTAGPIVLTSVAGKLDIARGAGLTNVALVKDNGDGSAIYSIDLSREP